MTAVERLFAFANVQSEAPYFREVDKQLESSSWPAQGSIAFHDLSMRYRPELPLVLKNVSFAVRPGEKIGICGRTGLSPMSCARWFFLSFFLSFVDLLVCDSLFLFVFFSILFCLFIHALMTRQRKSFRAVCLHLPCSLHVVGK